MVLYLKYRPQTLDEVIGQDQVKTTLEAAFKSNQLAHAYLFCGPRGTGKTSTARILAKMVNCEKVITADRLQTTASKGSEVGSKQSLRSDDLQKTESPQITSTSPSPLDQTILLPDQAFSISFNQPLEGLLALKTSSEPKLDLDIKLSDDRKTLTVKPKKSYQLGGGMTFTILPDTGFEDGSKLGQEEVFHIKTIQYKGI